MFTNRYLPRCFNSYIGIFVAITIASVVMSGCGYHPPFSVVKVSGKVTYEDGTLIPASVICLTFLSQTPASDPRLPPKQGVAYVDVKTGQFDAATTYDSKDGIIAGEHKVVVSCSSDNRSAGKLIPAEYGSSEKTPLKVNSKDSPFTIKIPKPR